MVLAIPNTGFSIFLDFQLQDMYISPSIDNLYVRYYVCCTHFPHKELAALILLLAFLQRKQKHTVNVNIHTQIHCRTIYSCHGLIFPWCLLLSKYTMWIFILSFTERRYRQCRMTECTLVQNASSHQTGKMGKLVVLPKLKAHDLGNYRKSCSACNVRQLSRQASNYIRRHS